MWFDSNGGVLRGTSNIRHRVSVAIETLFVALKRSVYCWNAAAAANMKAYSLPTVNGNAAARPRRPDMRKDGVQAGHIVANLAVANQLWIVHIPAGIVGVIGMALPALGCHISLEAHVMGVKVAKYRPPVFMIPLKVTPWIITVIC